MKVLLDTVAVWTCSSLVHKQEDITNLKPLLKIFSKRNRCGIDLFIYFKFRKENGLRKVKVHLDIQGMEDCFYYL